MISAEQAIELAVAELRRPRFALTEQFFAVHQIAEEDGRPAVAHVELDPDDGQAMVYFRLEDESYFWVVRVDGDADPPEVAWGWPEDEIHVELLISGCELTLEEISERIGLVPTAERRQGEGGPPAEENFWCFEVTPWKPACFEDKLTELLDFLRPYANSIAVLADQCRISLWIEIDGENVNGQHTWGITAEQVEQLAWMKASLDVSALYLGPSFE